MNSVASPRQRYEIRVIAPSASLSEQERRAIARAEKRLTNKGYLVSYGKAVWNTSFLGTASVEDRLSDFNTAYADKNVRAVMALTGGWSANELLPRINWRLVQENPKPFVGYSDNTVLANALYTATGCPSLLGPNLHTLSRATEWQYSLENLDLMLRQDVPRRLERSRVWSDGPRALQATKPWKVLQPGEAEARLIGGNLGSFYLLQGTPYQPRVDVPFVFAAEDDDESGALTSREFSRRLESILQIPGARDNIKGLVIGRFQQKSKVKEADIERIVSSKDLGTIPVISGVDFGHTLPMLTLPIGGVVRIEAGAKKAEILIQDIKLG